MNVTLLTYGTRGDVQPFVALGLGLRRAGHGVRLAAPGVFADFVAGRAGRGLEFVPLPGDPAELSRALVDEAQGSPVRTIQAISRFATPLAATVMRSARDACAGSDAVVHSFLLTLAGHSLAQERGIPDFSAQTFPSFAPSRTFGAVGLPGWPGGGWPGKSTYNLLSHRLMDFTFFRFSQLAYNGLRRDHPDLPRRIEWPFGGGDGRPPTPILAAISPQVFPPPADWPPRNHVTGYWFLEEAEMWQPPLELLHFLRSGPPPVCIGFGSVVTGREGQLARIAREAVEQAGLRAILLGGWTGMGKTGPLTDRILRLESAPHDWLFPRVAAVVHHGGAGTTAAGLRAGAPSVITPFASDQPFWAGRVQALGVGPRPIPIGQLNARNLAAALRSAVGDAEIGRRAAALGERIRAEDGVARAVAVIEGRGFDETPDLRSVRA